MQALAEARQVVSPQRFAALLSVLPECSGAEAVAGLRMVAGVAAELERSPSLRESGRSAALEACGTIAAVLAELDHEAVAELDRAIEDVCRWWP